VLCDHELIGNRGVDAASDRTPGRRRSDFVALYRARVGRPVSVSRPDAVCPKALEKRDDPERLSTLRLILRSAVAAKGRAIAMRAQRPNVFNNMIAWSSFSLVVEYALPTSHAVHAPKS
jgi:hypothetical protein